MNNHSSVFYCTLLMVHILSVLTNVAATGEEQTLCNRAIKQSACQVLEAHNANKPSSCSILEEDICRNWEADCNGAQRPDFCPPIYGSCLEAYNSNSSLPSGLYMIRLSDGTVAETYCDMNGANCDAQGAGWTRVAFLDMTQPGSTCPTGLQLFTSGMDNYCRATSDGCSSTVFKVTSDPYTEVCGMLRGYQKGITTGFFVRSGVTVEDTYLDGVSISHGSPGSRVYIWSYTAGAVDSGDTSSSCPCNTDYEDSAFLFIANDYYCESGRTSNSPVSGVFTNDTLWDGSCSTNEIQCCNNFSASQPWFTKTFMSNTMNNIETRVCRIDSAAGEVIIDMMEIYVR